MKDSAEATSAYRLTVDNLWQTTQCAFGTIDRSAFLLIEQEDWLWLSRRNRATLRIICKLSLS